MIWRPFPLNLVVGLKSFVVIQRWVQIASRDPMNINCSALLRDAASFDGRPSSALLSMPATDGHRRGSDEVLRHQVASELLCSLHTDHAHVATTSVASLF